MNMTHFSKSLVIFLALNLLLITLVSSCPECGGGSPTPKPPKHTPTPHIPTPSVKPPPSGGGGGGGGGGGNCPKDVLKLGACANVLHLLKLKVGNPPGGGDCCPLIQNIIDADAAICLCTNIKLGVLGLNLNIPVDLSLLLNYCGCKLPRGFQCV